jgi:hypothetical protein
VPEWSKRWALVAAVAVVAAAAGIVGGLALHRGGHETGPLVVISRTGAGTRGHPAVLSGALVDDPQQGVVLLEDRALGTQLFTMPSRSGPLRLIAQGPGAWTFDTPSGARAVVSYRGDAAIFEVLGRRLDPARLPPLATRGLAVPIVYGPAHSRAVLLVGDVPRRGFPLYGYLPGFTVPARTDPSALLDRPLQGPDGHLYTIDAAARRLVRGGVAPETTPEPQGLPPRCTTWGRYRACADSISVVGARGTWTSVLRQPPESNRLTRRWTFLAPSPDGRTLLLGQAIYACGADRRTYFMAARGGPLRPAAGDITANSVPIGWAAGGLALVALEHGECGSSSDGIYVAYPDGEDYPVVKTSGEDATSWGGLFRP